MLRQISVFVAACLLASTAAQAMEITITDAVSGAPLPNFRLLVQAFHQQERFERDVTTDNSGKVSVAIPFTQAHQLCVRMRHAEYVKLNVIWPRDGQVGRIFDIPKSVSLPAQTGKRVSGIVVDDAGLPVARAKVTLRLCGRIVGVPDANGIVLDNVTTGADGRWQLDRAQSEIESADIGVNHANVPKPMNLVETFEAIDTLHAGTARLILPRGRMIEGVVLGKGDQPVAGAQVTRMLAMDRDTVKTGADGRFSLPARPGEDVDVIVRADGYALDVLRVDRTDGVEPIKFRLLPPNVLRGRVVDPSGKPIKGAHVSIGYWRNSLLPDHWLTDAEGRFEWNQAPSDRVGYRVHAEGYASIEHLQLVAGQQEHTISMQRPLKILGRVVDAQTNQPVPAFRVTIGLPGRGRSTHWNTSSTRKHDGGKFEFDFTHSQPGCLRVEADGYVPSDSRVFEVKEGQIDLQFRLERGQRISGVVRDSHRRPVKAKVAIAGDGPRVFLINGKVPEESGVEEIETSEEGAFSFSPQKGKFTVVAFTTTGYAEQDSDKANGRFELTLSPWARIEGTVTVRGKPERKAEVEILTVVTKTEVGEPILFHQHSVVADENGWFVIERVRPGSIRVGRATRVVGNQLIEDPAGERQITAVAGQTVQAKIGD